MDDKRQSNQQDRATRFLLGTATPEERAAFEDAFFEEDDLLDETLVAEQDLLDEYVRGELAAEDSRRFERRYCVSPKHFLRVAVAKELMGRAGRGQFRAAASTRWLVVAAAAAVLVIGTATVLRQSASRSSTTMSSVQRESRVSRETRAEVTATLLPGLTRGPGERRPIEIPRQAESVILRLVLTRQDSPRYRVTIDTPEGVRAWDTSADVAPQSAPDGRVIIVNVPARQLKPADYVVRVLEHTPRNTESTVEAYTFRTITR